MVVVVGKKHPRENKGEEQKPCVDCARGELVEVRDDAGAYDSKTLLEREY